MAGYTRLHPTDPWYIFRVGDPDLDKNIREANNNIPDIILELNGVELDAALWGLENYHKNSGNLHRDRYILTEFAKGMSRRNISQKHQIPYSTVCKVIRKSN